MFTEKDMENAIICNPEKYIEEEGLKLITQQFHIGKYIFDLLFEDRHRGKLIVELQKGTLDRNHTYKILDYYDEYKESHPKEFIDLMVIANTIPPERKKRLSALGITFKEIPLSEFIHDLEETHALTYQEKIPKLSEMSSSRVKNTDTVIGSYELFKSQKNQFIKVLKEYDPNTKVVLDWKDLNEDNIRGKKNWFFVFYPPGWEVSKGPGFGVFFGLGYCIEKRTKADYVRFGAGVESPVKDEYKKKFKDEVVEELRRRKVILSEFDLWPNAGPRKVKLLDIRFPLETNSWKKAMEYYKKLDAFIPIVSEKIKEFRGKGYFK